MNSCVWAVHATPVTLFYFQSNKKEQLCLIQLTLFSAKNILERLCCYRCTAHLEFGVEIFITKVCRIQKSTMNRF